MKNTCSITLGILLIVLNLNTSCTGKKKTSNDVVDISIKVDTLCEKGKAIIEDSLIKYDGIVAVKAHMRKKIVSISYDSTKENKDKLVAALERLGFKTEFTKPDTKINNPCSDNVKQ
jgi:copper chaperone CopZ